MEEVHSHSNSEENSINESARKHADDNQILQFLNNEQYVLQTARSATAYDANSRASIFIGSVSSGVVALAFIGQVSEVGAAFYLFALVLFPSLFFLGLVTFVRALQTSMEDTLHARGMARVRHYYAEIAPEIQDYIIHSIHDDRLGVLHDMAISQSRLQGFVSTSGTILVVNSILAGAWLALAAQYFIAPPLWLTAIIAAFLFIVALLLQYFYQIRRWEDFEAHLTAKFPTPNANLR